MRAKKRNRALIGILVLWILTASTPGCDRYTRHKVLTFFFTGVPPLEEEREKGAAPEKEKPAQVSQAERRRRLIQRTTPFVHGPYGARMCDLCHEASSAVGFRRFGQKGAQASVKGGRQMPGRVLVPIRKLCIGCHTQKSPQRAYADGLWLHGPAAAGNCTLCHSPHRSENPYMLREKPGKLCVQCHGQGYIMNVAVHVDSKDCLACHNAHLGKDALLLKKDFREIF